MRFALVNEEIIEARKGLRGVCPVCRKSVISKCGELKINHWAHSAKAACDSWWERETLWHRLWKSNFPFSWQEIIMHDQETGERHIADVRTSSGLVIEFQHSFLNPEERISREGFYRNMIWVVDGNRLKRDYDRFSKAIEDRSDIKINMPFIVQNIERYFPRNWLTSSMPVVFDFRESSDQNSKDRKRDFLWWLFPGRVDSQAIVQAMPFQDFVQIASNSTNLQQEIERIKKEFIERILSFLQMQKHVKERAWSARSYYEWRRRGMPRF